VFNTDLPDGVNMSLVYAWEKLHLAVDSLCGHGSQTARLADAVKTYLVHVRPDDLPADLRREFMQVMSELKAVEVHGEEANIQATVGSLDASARERAIRKILHIYSAVCRHFEA
jgi:hypothetical protein